MKKYMTPDMKVMAFMAEETIADSASLKEAANKNGSNHFNDAEFGGW